ncbi:MAG: 2-nitropropane dioxygenase, partial [Frankiales bacterium]|nr:2-nitropropane dioxygenase [Frankiales bacterium]
MNDITGPADLELLLSDSRGDRMTHRQLPRIIQGGMGVGVSGWQLANAVSRAGALGVVSGTALDVVLTRRLQLGDPGGQICGALAAFPYPATSARILTRYLRTGAAASAGKAFRPSPQLGLRTNASRDELAVAANFVEVYLAKQGHDGPVGVNYLEKIQLATPAAVYGAMLAGVDVVLMGAGVPAQLPRLLDDFAAGRAGSIDLTVEGAVAGERHPVTFDPFAVFGAAPVLTRPRFLAVIASHAIAVYLARDAATVPDGFVVESPVAGGHSARPRGQAEFDKDGQPVYGPRDEADLEKLHALGLPFWLAGG